MLKFIAILLNRITFHEYTSEFTLFTLQNRESNITSLIITIIFLLIWFSCGLILAYWVKKDQEKRNLEGNRIFFLILLTGFIGFIIYIIVSRGEIIISENDKSYKEIDEIIKNEEEAEFRDEIEEIGEEEVEEVIEQVLKDIKVKAYR